MSRISRREFLASATAAVGVSALVGVSSGAGHSTFAIAAPPKIKRGTDLVTLGKSGIKTSVLGIGTGTRGGREQRELGYDGFTKLARHALDRGVRYIDTADTYQMHDQVRTALKGVPREKYFLQTKTRAKDAAAAKADLDRFRKELGVEYFDTLLMHCMQSGSWPTDMRPVMDVLSDAKEKGIARAVGISCHGMDPLVASVDVDWIDVQLARINPFGQKMDGEPAEVAAQLKKMHAKGRGMLGMKIYGESGFDSKEKRLESLRYVLGLGSIDAFTIGFSSTKQIDETLELIELAFTGAKSPPRPSVSMNERQLVMV